MNSFPPKFVVAGIREAGARCVACREEIVRGGATAVCETCGALSHETCWQHRGGCSSYNCSPGSIGQRPESPVIKITEDELAHVEPLPARSTTAFKEAGSLADQADRRWNRAAIWSFVTALLGIPLFGLITGFVAIVVGCIALVTHTHRLRGAGLAVAAIVVGLIDIVGWTAGLYYFFGEHHVAVSFDEFAVNVDDLDGLPVELGDALRANVLITTSSGFASQGIGSGVIIGIDHGLATILTNRHVIDSKYTDKTTTVDLERIRKAEIVVETIGELPVPATVEWVSPYGVDLAVLSAPTESKHARAMHWDSSSDPKIGDEAFAIGNPHGLGWTHSAGTISQIRRHDLDHGRFQVRLLQTTTALNPGNSGGGLYDQQGRLIAINSMAGDKRVAEGLGFSIALSPAVWDLLPAHLRPAFHKPEEVQQ